jgi:hypothetical protein
MRRRRQNVESACLLLSPQLRAQIAGLLPILCPFLRGSMTYEYSYSAWDCILRDVTMFGTIVEYECVGGCHGSLEAGCAYALCCSAWMQHSGRHAARLSKRMAGPHCGGILSESRACRRRASTADVGTIVMRGAAIVAPVSRRLRIT